MTDNSPDEDQNHNSLQPQIERDAEFHIKAEDHFNYLTGQCASFGLIVNTNSPEYSTLTTVASQLANLDLDANAEDKPAKLKRILLELVASDNDTLIIEAVIRHTGVARLTNNDAAELDSVILEMRERNERFNMIHLELIDVMAGIGVDLEQDLPNYAAHFFEKLVELCYLLRYQTPPSNIESEREKFIHQIESIANRFSINQRIKSACIDMLS